MAFDADKTIIPFKLDSAQPQGDLRYDLYGVEYIDATVPTKEQRIYELAKAISKAIGKPLLSENSVGVAASERLVSMPSVLPKNVFCGRDDVISEISQKFADGERVVFVSGIGGIGKTKIVKQYANRNRSDYNTIIFASYTDSLVALINGETPFELEPEFARRVSPDGIPEDDRAFFERKLRKIQKLADERTLIIIDNFDVENDDALPMLLEGRYRLLITTRCDYSRVYPTVKVGEIESIESLVGIFMQNYGGFEVDENDPDLIELIELVNRHTYTIELLAQHMENSGQTAREMITALQNEGILSLNEEVGNAGNRTRIAYVNLLKMFKVFELDALEKRVLIYLSLMPTSGAAVRSFKVWAGLDSLKVLRDLDSRVWIVRHTDRIALHTIIRDVIRHELPAYEKNCAEFIRAFSDTIEEGKAWHYTLAEKERYAEIAASLIANFPEINADTVTLYRYVESLYSFAVKPAAAAEMAERIYNYFESTEGKYTYSTGRSAFKVGWVFAFNRWLNNSLENATKWLEIAADIFENIELPTTAEYSVYGMTLVNLSKVSLLAGKAYDDKRYYEKAKSYAEAAVSGYERRIPKEDPKYSRVAGGYMQLTDVCIALGDYNRAMQLNDEAYEILHSLFGDDDTDTLHALARKLRILFAMKRFEEVGERD